MCNTPTWPEHSIAHRAARSFRMLSRKQVCMRDSHYWDAAKRPIGAILSLVEAAHASAAAALDRY